MARPFKGEIKVFPNRKCNTCGKIFKSRYSADYLKKHSRFERFCSKPCGYASRNSRVELACKVCGKKIIIFKSELKYNRGQFCSKSCGGKWYSQHRFGPNHPLYKLNAANRKYRTDSQPYRKWRKAVLDRDNHRCTECEATDNLEIDRGVCSQSNLTVVGF